MSAWISSHLLTVLVFAPLFWGLLLLALPERMATLARLLALLGVNIDADAATAARCLREAGVCFCFAVRCHPAMRYAAPVRKSLGVRTIFNVLGPLTNPAGATSQLMGVFDARWTDPIAHVLKALGSRSAMVVHADDGLDEISTTSVTRISCLRDGQVADLTVKPEDFSLARACMEDLLVTTAAESADAIRKVLAGAKGPHRDIVLLNAAAALAVAGKAADIPAGLAMAADSIDLGAAASALSRLIAVSGGRN